MYQSERSSKKLRFYCPNIFTVQRFKFQLEEDGTDVVIEDKDFLQKLDDFCNNRTKLWIG